MLLQKQQMNFNCLTILFAFTVSSFSVNSFQMPQYNNNAILKRYTLEKRSFFLSEGLLGQMQQTGMNGRVHLGAQQNGEFNEDESDENPNTVNKEFKPNKPISLPSLENPKDAGPLYNTCKSVTGIQNIEESSNDNSVDEENEPFIPNKPIQLDSLKNQDMDRSFLGLQPRTDDDDEVPLLMETGLGLFTSSLILGGSIYFILAVFLDGDNVDPTAIPLSF